MCTVIGINIFKVFFTQLCLLYVIIIDLVVDAVVGLILHMILMWHITPPRRTQANPDLGRERALLRVAGRMDLQSGLSERHAEETPARAMRRDEAR